MDGALIACETVHWMKKNKKRVALIKLDFQKVYDLVKWNFVDLTLERVGFVTNGEIGYIGVCLLHRCQLLLIGHQLNLFA